MRTHPSRVTTWTAIHSPLGELVLAGDGESLAACGPLVAAEALTAPAERDDDAFVDARTQLAEYFAGAREHFDLSLAPVGTPFQQQVWAALQAIPYGETRSYGELARLVGRPQAARAVGMANARNPIAIIVPCHRVVGGNGRLTGYAHGLERKRWLLDLERR